MRFPWHAAAAWDRVAKGMTEAQAVEVLGQPTAIESIGSLKTLFYRGTAPGGAFVSGHVDLRDDRIIVDVAGPVRLLAKSVEVPV